MELSERIKRQRKAVGMNQIELAERISLSINTIRRWESGQRSPRAEELAKLAAALHTTVGYLMGIEEDAAPEQKTLEIPSRGLEQEAPETTRGKVEDAGTLTYTSSNGEKIELPATEKGYALFERLLVQKGVVPVETP